MVNMMNVYTEESEFEIRLHFNVFFRTNTPGKGMKSLISHCPGLPLLFFNKYVFGTKYLTKVYIPLNFLK